MKRRRVIQLVLLLVLLISGGAIVNVAVAWGCVLGDIWTVQVGNTTVITEGEIAELWAKHAPTSWPQANVHGYRLRFLLTSSATLDVTENGEIWLVSVTRSGWPFRTLSGTYLDSKTENGWKGAWNLNNRIALPLRPLWPGLAINTIFYAAILWVVFFVPGKVKRTLRRRRCQCPACAYPVGTSEVCTECGAALL